MRDLEWFVPVSICLAIELLLWWLAFAAGYSFRPLLKASGLITNGLFLLVVSVKVVTACVRMARAGEKHPLSRLATRENLLRAIMALAMLQMLVIGGSAFGALKAGIPKLVPFWLDIPLASAEQSIFGLDAWQISHALLGWATPLIDVIYVTYLPVETMTWVIVLCMRPSEFKSRAIVTISLAWLLLGIFGAYALSSAGPIFYDRIFGGDRFAQLNDAIDLHAPLAASISNVLWQAHSLNKEIAFNGISAMPSLHVAGSLWIALLLRRTRFAIFGWIYYAAIWIGSVHLGWHYFSDGAVASIAVLAIWRFSPRILYRPAPKLLARAA